MSQPLNDQQFAAQPAGASRRLIGGTPAPSQGFMVSRHRSEGHEEDMPEARATARVVGNHLALNRQKALANTPVGEKGEVYQGIWKDSTDNNHTYLDISDRVGSFTDAVHRGRRNDQYAIYDLGRKATVDLARGRQWNTAKASPTSTKPNVGPSYSVTRDGYR